MKLEDLRHTNVVTRPADTKRTNPDEDESIEIDDNLVELFHEED